jgi:predicted RNase H-like HicB family nuclease
MKYRYTVVIERDEDGMYVAYCPALQGCYTQGKTYEEVMRNIKEAIELSIEARKEMGEEIPIEMAIEEVEIDESEIKSHKARAIS